MKIRQATLKDFLEIRQLQHQCFSSTEKASADVLKKRLKHHSYNYVIEEENHVISYILAEETEYSLFVHSLVVKKNYRQKGYATTLLKHIMNQAKIKNISRIELLAKDDKILFYQKLGFQKEVQADSIWHKMVYNVNVR